MLFATAVLLLSHWAIGQRVLTLEEARQLAVSRNNNLKAAQEKIEAAKAQKAEADAKGKPRLDGSVNSWGFGKPLNAMFPDYGITPSYDSFNAYICWWQNKIRKRTGGKRC